MMRAAEIARERGIPYFGIFYGFQWAAVEYARHVCGLTDADSTECAPDTPIKLIYKLRDLLGVDDLGGTMRLGSYACQLRAGSRSHALYGSDVIHERHRHRYEFNCLYEKTLTDPVDRQLFEAARRGRDDVRDVRRPLLEYAASHGVKESLAMFDSSLRPVFETYMKAIRAEIERLGAIDRQARAAASSTSIT